MRRVATLGFLVLTACPSPLPGASMPVPANGPIAPTFTAAAPTEGMVPTATDNGWTVSLPNRPPVTYTPAVMGDTVYVSGGFTTMSLYALDAATGAPKWGTTLTDTGPTAPVATPTAILVNTESCTTFAVEPKNGKIAWSHYLADPLTGAASVGGNLVYSGYPDGNGGKLAALELATGATKWTAGLDADVLGAPIVSGGSVYVTTWTGAVSRLAADTGAVTWTANAAATSPVWPSGDRLYVAVRSQRATGPFEGLQALDAATGKPIGPVLAEVAAPWLDSGVQKSSGYADAMWAETAAVSAAYSSSSPKAKEHVGLDSIAALTVYQGSRPMVVGPLVVATLGDRVVAVDPATEVIAWTMPLGEDLRTVGGHLGSAPVLASGHLFVGTASGYVLALDPQTGAVAWKGDVGSPIRTEPAVVDGIVYVSTATGRVVRMDSGLRGGGDWEMAGGGMEHAG